MNKSPYFLIVPAFIVFSWNAFFINVSSFQLVLAQSSAREEARAERLRLQGRVSTLNGETWPESVSLHTRDANAQERELSEMSELSDPGRIELRCVRAPLEVRRLSTCAGCHRSVRESPAPTNVYGSTVSTGDDGSTTENEHFVVDDVAGPHRNMSKEIADALCDGYYFPTALIECVDDGTVFCAAHNPHLTEPFGIVCCDADRRVLHWSSEVRASPSITHGGSGPWSHRVRLMHDESFLYVVGEGNGSVYLEAFDRVNGVRVVQIARLPDQVRNVVAQRLEQAKMRNSIQSAIEWLLNIPVLWVSLPRRTSEG